MTIQTACLIGLAAALTMFCGDMLLYFTKGPFEMDGTLKPYAGIMKRLPVWRLRLGGVLGPIAAFLYCIGFFQITLAAVPGWEGPALALTLLCALGIIIGGAYHSQFAYFGLLGKVADEEGEVMPVVIKNVSFLSSLSIGVLAVGVLLLAVLIGIGKTHYPRWFVLGTPAALYFLNLLWAKLPQPFRCILSGGWYNLMFAVYFLLALLLA